MTNPRVTSSFCSGGDCVEVEQLDDGGVRLRDTKHPAPALYFTGAEWRAFVAGVKAGQFDPEALRRDA